jgi:hypothetical protein
MGLLASALRVSEDAAAAITGAAGALTGAVTGGAVGAVTGTARGASQGLGLGVRSTPAAALALVAVGAVGLVEWPVLLAAGGTLLVLQQLRNNPPADTENSADSHPRARATTRGRKSNATADPLSDAGTSR